MIISFIVIIAWLIAMRYVLSANCDYEDCDGDDD